MLRPITTTLVFTPKLTLAVVPTITALILFRHKVVSTDSVTLVHLQCMFQRFKCKVEFYYLIYLRWSRSHCDCDDRFRSCLASLSDNVSQAVGLLFFDVGALPCFRPHDSAQRGQCSNHSATNTRFKRHCDGTGESEMLWEFSPAKSFKTTHEGSRSFGGYESGTSSLTQALAKLGDVTTIVRSVVDSTLKTRRVGRKFE